jgi:hypothetical protein
VINDYLLYIDIFEGIGIADQLRIILNALLVALKGLRSASIRAGTHIVNAFCGYSSRDKPADEGNGMRGASIDGNILWFFNSAQQLQVG